MALQPTEHEADRATRPEKPELSLGAVRVDLPCIGCGYNIKGLIPHAVCPECGLELQQTLRFVIDPAKSEIEPLSSPRRLGSTLIGITGLMFTSAIILWVPHLLHLTVAVTGASSRWNGSSRWCTTIAAGLGVLVLALAGRLSHPTGRPGPPEYRRGRRLSRFGVTIWAGMLVVLSSYDMAWPDRWISHFDPEEVDFGRSAIRLGLDLAAIAMAIGFRPVVRFLAIRSLNHRVGRISRQGFYTITVAVIVVTIGDAMHLGLSLLAPMSLQQVRVTGVVLAGAMLIMMGSLLLTLALLNAFVDALRLNHGMNRPAFTLLEEIVEVGD